MRNVARTTRQTLATSRRRTPFLERGYGGLSRYWRFMEYRLRLNARMLRGSVSANHGGAHVHAHSFQGPKEKRSNQRFTTMEFCMKVDPAPVLGNVSDFVCAVPNG